MTALDSRSARERSLAVFFQFFFYARHLNVVNHDQFGSHFTPEHVEDEHCQSVGTN